MRRLLLALALVGAIGTPARAEDNPFAWPAHRRLADYVSTAAVGVQIGADVVTRFRSEDRGRALGCQALRTGLVVGVAEITKRVVRRERPDGSDHLSFFSAHTALASVSAGWRVSVSVPVAIGVGYLRPAAHKHYVTDVLVGALVGVSARYVCPG